MRIVVQAVALSILAVWWMFFLLWQPGFVRVVQTLAFRFTPPNLNLSMVSQGTTRALEYSTKGTPQQSDIFFTSNEVRHLNDVSNLYQPLRLVLGIGALLSAGFLIFEAYKRTLDERGFLFSSRFFTIIGILMCLAVVFFAVFFVAFHEVLFPQGNWAFPADSLLIQLFPEIFWRLMLTAILLLVLMTAVLYWAIARWLYD